MPHQFLVKVHPYSFFPKGRVKTTVDWKGAPSLWATYQTCRRRRTKTWRNVEGVVELLPHYTINTTVVTTSLTNYCPLPQYCLSNCPLSPKLPPLKLPSTSLLVLKLPPTLLYLYSASPAQVCHKTRNNTCSSISQMFSQVVVWGILLKKPYSLINESLALKICMH